MVTTDISQLAAECNTWRSNLRKYREDFTQCKHRLQEVASRQIPKNLLQDIEHYHNQFHIQLINIHDLAVLPEHRGLGVQRVEVTPRVPRAPVVGGRLEDCRLGLRTARELHLSVGTVRNYLSSIMRKAGARTRLEAIRIAVDSGWL